MFLTRRTTREILACKPCGGEYKDDTIEGLYYYHNAINTWTAHIHPLVDYKYSFVMCTILGSTAEECRMKALRIIANDPSLSGCITPATELLLEAVDEPVQDIQE